MEVKRIPSLNAAGEDYQQLSVDLTFGEGSEKRCVETELVNDTTFEGPEQFMVLLSTMEVGMTLSSDNATILIQDDDSELRYVEIFLCRRQCRV